MVTVKWRAAASQIKRILRQENKTIIIIEIRPIHTCLFPLVMNDNKTKHVNKNNLAVKKS